MQPSEMFEYIHNWLSVYCKNMETELNFERYYKIYRIFLKDDDFLPGKKSYILIMAVMWSTSGSRIVGPSSNAQVKCFRELCVLAQNRVRWREFAETMC